MTTTKEDRELDAWIWENVVCARLEQSTIDPRYTCCMVPLNTPRGLLPGKCVRRDNGLSVGSWLTDEVPDRTAAYYAPRIATDPAAALDLLAKCAEKLNLQGEFITISVRGGKGKWRVGSLTSYCDEPALPLAISKFAKSLFSKKAQGGE